MSRGYKSTNTGNKHSESILRRIKAKKGKAHNERATLVGSKCSFEFDNEIWVSVSMYEEPNNVNNYYLVYVTPKNEWRDNLVKCSNLRGKKIYDEIVKQYKVKNR